MKQSPIFKHAVESFEHGLEHYLDGSERSRKFALLHIDQAVELLLKEKVMRSGKSIYKGDGTTLNFHETFNSLKDTKVPERPRLEELHDLRNTIQHKGLTPDPESTRFYVEIAYYFLKRFLNEELEVLIEEVVSKQYRALVEGQSLPEMAEALLLVQNARNAATSTEKILTGYTALSKIVDCLSDSGLGKTGFRRTLREAVAARGVDYKKLKPHLDVIQKLRSKVVYSEYIPTDDEANAFLNAVENVFEKIGAV